VLEEMLGMNMQSESIEWGASVPSLQRRHQIVDLNALQPNTGGCHNSGGPSRAWVGARGPQEANRAGSTGWMA
jgi:hypothetical protein